MNIGFPKLIEDRLGNTIVIDEGFHTPCNLDFDEFCKVLSRPTYIIEEKGKAINFFRLVDNNVNLLVVAERKGANYIIGKCIINPSKELIVELLSNGNLITF